MIQFGNKLLGIKSNSFEGDFASLRKRNSKKNSSTLLRPMMHQKLRAKLWINQNRDGTKIERCTCQYVDYPSDVPPRQNSSPTTEIVGNKKPAISRKHYGSVETLKSRQLPEGCTTYPSRFKVEYGDLVEGKTTSPPNTPVHLENPEFQTRWYFKYFLGKIHQNYVGVYDDKNIFVLSVVLTEANNHNVPQYRAILWTRKGSEKMCLQYNPNKPLSTKAILSSFTSVEKIEKGPKEIFSPNLQKELLLLEEQEGSISFKFGVVYAKQDQKSDDEMLSNEFGSEEFNKFLTLLGQRIKLKGWKRFKGGLDNKNNTTGEEAIFTTFEGNEIIFHVSTLLPYSKENQQQLERKRHIGNDIVNIIYQEIESNQFEKSTFQPRMFKSQFTHIFAVVTFCKENKTYRLEVFSEESVPVFGPPLRNSPEFPNHQEFRDFLLVKLINGEKAAFNTPIFRQKRERTLDMLLHNIYETYVGAENGKNEKNMVNRRAFSDVFIDSPKISSKRKEENRQADFQRAGQILKLNTIVRGDAPTNISASSLLKREPWEPNCFYANYKHDIICGDSFGPNLIVATKDAGINLFEEGCEPRCLFDKTVSAKQLSVFEEHGIMLFLTDRGKDSKINVFRLSDFVGMKNQTLIRNRNHCKENKIEPTRGCHLYAFNKHPSTKLKIAAAMGKKLLLMEWKHLAYWSDWYPQSDFDTVEGFHYVKEINLPEVPQTMVWLDSNQPSNTGICVGYKYYFDLYNESTSHIQRLLTIDTPRSLNVLNIVDIGEEDDFEIMLCHNRTVYYKKLGNNGQSYEFHWNSIPDSIVCSFPYILGFTGNGIEIRLAINGNLVDTIELPRVKLICAKNDIYFDSPLPDAYASMRTREKDKLIENANMEHAPFNNNVCSGSPPVSPSTSLPRHIYQISINTFLTACSYSVNNNNAPSSSSHPHLSRRSTNIPTTHCSNSFKIPSPRSTIVRRQSSYLTSAPSPPFVEGGTNAIISTMPPSPSLINTLTHTTITTPTSSPQKDRVELRNALVRREQQLVINDLNGHFDTISIDDPDKSGAKTSVQSPITVKDVKMRGKRGANSLTFSLTDTSDIVDRVGKLGQGYHSFNRNNNNNNLPTHRSDEIRSDLRKRRSYKPLLLPYVESNAEI